MSIATWHDEYCCDMWISVGPVYLTRVISRLNNFKSFRYEISLLRQKRRRISFPYIYIEPNWSRNLNPTPSENGKMVAVAVAEWEWEMVVLADTGCSRRSHSHIHQRLPSHSNGASFLQPILRCCFPITLLFKFQFKFFALLDQAFHWSPRHHCPRCPQVFPNPYLTLSLSSSSFWNKCYFFDF